MFSKRQITYIMTLVYLLLFLAVIGFVYFIAPKILIWLMPFIIAYIFSAIAMPISRLLNRGLKIPLKVARAISSIFVLLFVGTLIAFLIIKLVSELSGLASHLPAYVDIFIKYVKDIPDVLADLFKSLPPDVTGVITNIINNITLDMANIQQLAMKALSSVGTIVVSMPSVIIFIFFTILSTFFLSIDREMISRALKRSVPQRIYDGVVQAKRNFFAAIWGYIRAQMIMFVIVSCELMIGFSLIKVNYIVALALIIALLDALPVFGVGTVLLPWGLICIGMRDYRLGVSLLAMYAIMFTVRQIIEPKIVSAQIGLHPLLTLLSMYAGLKTFGFIGMILFPLTLIIIINLYKAGIFSNVKSSVLGDDIKNEKT